MKTFLVPILPLSVAVCCLWLPLRPASAQRAEPTGSELAQRIDALRQAQKNKPASGPQRGDADVRELVVTGGEASSARDVSGMSTTAYGAVAELGTMENYVRSGQYTQAISLAQRSARDTDNPALKPLWEALVADLRKEQARVDKEARERFESLFKKVAETALSAKSSEELNPVLDELADLSNGGYRSTDSAAVRRLSSQISYVQNFLEYWGQYLDSLAAGQPGEAMSSLNNVRSAAQYRAVLRYFPAGALEKRRAALREPMVKQARKSLDEARAFVTKPGATAGDCRRALALLEENRLEYNNSESLGNDLSQLYDRARNGLRAWIEAVEAEAAGGPEAAAQKLSNYLSNYGREESFVPRETANAMRTRLAAAILKHPASLPEEDPALREIAADLDKANSPADLDRIAAAAAAMRNSIFREDSQAVYPLPDVLKSLRGTWEALDDGRYRDVLERSRPGQSYNYNSVWQSRIDAIHRRLVLRAVAAEWKLPLPKEPVDEKKGEDIVRAAADDAYKAADWPRLLDLLQAEKAVTRGGSSSGCCGGNSGDTPEAVAVRDFLSGRNLEEAGQFLEAARAYQRVVGKVGLRRIPRQQATERLAAIAKEHPATGEALNR